MKLYRKNVIPEYILNIYYISPAFNRKRKKKWKNVKLSSLKSDFHVNLARKKRAVFGQQQYIFMNIDHMGDIPYNESSGGGA